MTVKYSKDVLHVDLALYEQLKDTDTPVVCTSRSCQEYEGREVNQEGLIYGCEYGCAKRLKQTVEGYVPQHDLDATYIIDRVGTPRPEDEGNESEEPLGWEGITDGGRSPHSSFISKDGKSVDRRLTNL